MKEKSDKKNVLALIPARGGSKSVPKKNIRMINGKPLIAWTIEAALVSRYIDRVIVTTDSQEIADIAKKHGADVPFLRPREISGDLSTDIEFINHALDFLKDKEGYEPDIVLRLAPTSPLRTTEDIDEGIRKLLEDETLDCMRAIIEAPKHPYKMWKINGDGKTMSAFFPEDVTGFKHPYDEPRQKMPKVYTHGSIDIMRTKTIRRYGNVAGERIGFFILPSDRGLDIDDEADFDLAGFYLQRRKK